ncbi:ABC transporter substrate-binding protein [Bradyrhizobium jicamae]|uniref:ABC transporter substrate-binding protein n=1 Tax=Bradyrhizobium jicamae TaxID=280332 RepID=UPI001BAB5A26|nr:ABC transporter substrate-binding protein [Bradyrhizobium jicamae]MBR0934316.1 twin-arginine translocation signal domain-containing protein [Bradyrhizobium jicamae]
MRADISRRQFLGSAGIGVAALGYGSGFPALAADDEASAPKRGGVLTIGQDENPIGLDPHKTAAFSTDNIVEHIYTCLLRWDATASQVEPDLAVAWESPDPQTFVFHLREGVKFHNGDALASEDVKFTFQRLVDPATRSPWVSIFSVISAIETPDPRTVVFRLAKPFAPFLNYLATLKYAAIVSREDVKRRGDLIKGGVGTGPFMLEDFQPDSLVRLKRNPDYYELGLPYLDGLDFRIIPDEGSRMAALRAGSVQMTWLSSPDSAAQMRSVSNIVAPEPEAFSKLLLLEFDQRGPPFNDVRVRRAFSLALNRELIIKVVWRGRAGLAAALPPVQSPFAVPSGDVLGLPYTKEDVAAAKALMAEAGYAAGFDTTFAVSPSNYGDVQIAQIVQQLVGRIGIRIKILQKEWGNLVTDFQSTESPISMAGLVWGPDPDTNISIRLDSHSTVNPGKTADPVLDDMLAKARQSYDAAERVKLYRAVQQRVADMAYVITPCASALRWEMWSNKLQGYRTLPSTQRVYLRQAWFQ